MNDIDAVFSALRDETLPACLHKIDDAVIAELGAYREREVGRRGIVLAGFVAAFVGLTFGFGSGSSAAAEPLFGIPETAPSHLLGD